MNWAAGQLEQTEPGWLWAGEFLELPKNRVSISKLPKALEIKTDWQWQAVKELKNSEEMPVPEWVDTTIDILFQKDVNYFTLILLGPPTLAKQLEADE